MHYQMWIWSKFENVIAHFLIAMMEELIILYYVLFYMFLLMYYHYNDIMSYKEAEYMGKFKGADFADKTVYLLWTRRPSRNYAKAGMNRPVGVKTAHSCGHTSS